MHLFMNFLKRLFGSGAAKNMTPSAEPTKPMAAQPQALAGTPPTKGAHVPPDDMTLIDPVAKDTWRADQWRGQSSSSGHDKKK